jgi:hypothetical protein
VGGNFLHADCSAAGRDLDIKPIVEQPRFVVSPSDPVKVSPHLLGAQSNVDVEGAHREESDHEDGIAPKWTQPCKVEL